MSETLPEHVTNGITPPSLPGDEIASSDGACLSNQDRRKAAAGYSVFFGEGDERNVSAPVVGDKQTNNVGELMGVITAFERATPGRRLSINTDSQYVVRGLVGMDGQRAWHVDWVRRGWRKASGGAVANVELWKRLIGLAITRDFRLVWVKGHSTHAGNVAADKLAQNGAKASRAKRQRDGADEPVNEPRKRPAPQTSLPEMFMSAIRRGADTTMSAWLRGYETHERAEGRDPDKKK